MGEAIRLFLLVALVAAAGTTGVLALAWWMEPERRMTYAETAPKVAKPAALKRSARVSCASPSRKPMLSRTSCRGGRRPVNMEAWAGRVRGTWLITSSTTIPSRPSRSS